MKEIPLTQGKVALVDDEDYEWLIKFKWHYGAKYARISSQDVEMKSMSYMHRIIMKAPAGMLVDHANGDRLDNRKHNLRVCTKSQNEMNSIFQSNNKTGYKGVFWDQNRAKYRSEIGIDGKRVFLGRFDCKHEAARAYNTAAMKYHGEFARLNEPLAM